MPEPTDQISVVSGFLEDGTEETVEATDALAASHWDATAWGELRRR